MHVIQKSDRIKAINVACGKLGIGREERHTLQLSITGIDSLAKMSLPQLNDVLSHLNRIAKGDQTGDEWRFVFKLTPGRQTYAKKIYRLAQKIGAMQNPPVPIMTKAYVEGVAAQMRGCDQPLEFCEPDQLHKIVQALEVYVKRHGG